MRILFILRAPVGGLFRHVIDLANGARTAGHDVAIVFSHMASPAAISLINGVSNLGSYELKISRLPSFSDVFNVLTIRNIIKNMGIDLIHGHGAKGGLYSRLAALGRKGSILPNVYTLHGGTIHAAGLSLSGHFYKLVERALAPITSALIFESSFAKDAFYQLVPHFSGVEVVIFNGLQKYEFSLVKSGNDCADFIFLGEIRHLKGLSILLQATALLRSRNMFPKICIFGEGPDLVFFKNMASEMNLSNVFWKGASDGARPALSSGRCLIFPSLAESFSYVVLEAVAAGVPVIATRVGAVVDIVGEQGKIIAPGDSAQLMENMYDFLLNPQEFTDIAEISRYGVISKFSVEEMIEKTLDLYRKVTS